MPNYATNALNAQCGPGLKGKSIGCASAGVCIGSGEICGS